MPPLRLAGPEPAAAPSATSAAPAVADTPETPSQARLLYTQARALLKAHEREQAVTVLRQAVAQAQLENLPQEEQALFHRLLGLSLSSTDHDAEAIAAYQRSLELSQDDPECHLELAQILLRSRRYIEAIAQTKEALRLGLTDKEDEQDAQDVLRIAEARQLFLTGKELVRAGARRRSDAITTLKAAAAKAEEARLPSDERALIYYLLGVTLSRAAQVEQAIAALEQSLKLVPDNAEGRLELAELRLRDEDFERAKQEADRAMQLQLHDAEDRADAASVLHAAKLGALHDRLMVDAFVSMGYDSNVLEGNNNTTGTQVMSIGGTCTTCPSRLQQASASTEYQKIVGEIRSQQMLIQNLFTSYNSTVTGFYTVPSPPPQEWDLPITLQLDLTGRLVQRSSLELWGGYHFYQYLLTSVAYDHDAYNIQEHSVPVYLIWQPLHWLRFRPKVEGFVNFAGLKQFTPYQGGLKASLETTFIESRRFRTRLLYLHMLARSFDRANDAYLDDDRDDVKLTQEVRLRSTYLQVRGQLSYRFRSERMGTFVDSSHDLSPDFVYARQGTIMPVTLGHFVYNAPLGYLGNEVATRWRFFAPWKIELLAGLAYEYRSYAGLYTASFLPMDATVPYKDQMVDLPPAGTAASIPMPSQKRLDSLVTLDLSVLKNLPHGFGLELAYSFQHNASTVDNGIDNRNYNKHTVTLNAMYDF